MKNILCLLFSVLLVYNAFSQGGSDPTFNTGAGASIDIFAISIQSDGKIVIGGRFSSYNEIQRFRVARVNTDGSLDETFNWGTDVGRIDDIVIQPDGKIILVSYFGIVRLNTDGSLDATFNPGSGANGAIFEVALQNDGKILIGGQFTSYNGITRNNVARLNTDGSLDATFVPKTGEFNEVGTLNLQANGKIIISGRLRDGTYAQVVRLNTDGSSDPTFTLGVVPNNVINDVVIQPDGKIIIAGAFTRWDGLWRNRIARLNSDGSLDGPFNSGEGTNDEIYTVSLQSDGRIIIGGTFIYFGFGISRNRIARLNSNGSLDFSFDPGSGANSRVWTSAIDSNNKIIIGGGFTQYNGTERGRIARILPGFLLPVNLINVKAYQKSSTIQVEWTTLTETNADKFEVEKSTIGQSFIKIGTVQAIGNSTRRVDYKLSDLNPSNGSNYYRIKSIDKNGTAQYSNVVRVNVRSNNRLINVYPNPVTTNTVSLQLNNLEKGKYTVSLINKLGQRIYSSVIEHNGGTSIQTLRIEAAFPKGTYQFQVIGDELRMTNKLIKQ